MFGRGIPFTALSPVGSYCLVSSISTHACLHDFNPPVCGMLMYQSIASSSRQGADCIYFHEEVSHVRMRAITNRWTKVAVAKQLTIETIYILVSALHNDTTGLPGCGLPGLFIRVGDFLVGLA